MNMSDQVCSHNLAVKIKELGVSQLSLFCYQELQDSNLSLWPRNFELHEFKEPSEDGRIAAFTSAELGEMLPVMVMTYKKLKRPNQFECIWEVAEIGTRENTEANARAKMLIYLIENKLMEVTK